MAGIRAIAFAMIALGGHEHAHAEAVANFGVASNFVWRGFTMTNDRPAVSGGIDYLHPDNHYLGLWLSNIEDEEDENNEASRIELYSGTHIDFDQFNMEVGLIYYYYNRGNKFVAGSDTEPGTANDSSFGEFLLGATKGIFTARIHISDDYLGSGYSSRYWRAGID